MTRNADLLITDSLFIGPPDEAALDAAGLRYERLPVEAAPEDELIAALAGKRGYLLGGTEHVTARVLESTDVLEAIVFTGSGYAEHIDAVDLATERGVAIANTPGAVAPAVAEYALTLMLGMVRGTLVPVDPDAPEAVPLTSLAEHSVGIVGLGEIGRCLATMLIALGVEEVLYWNRTRRPEDERALGIAYRDLPDLLREASVVSLHVANAAGPGFIGATELALLPDDGLVINAAYPGAIDAEALRAEVGSGRLRAATDGHPPFAMEVSPRWWTTGPQRGFNTPSAVRRVSEMATRSMINLLTTGTDPYVVNGR
jgi:glyoxylate reductase